MCQQNQQKNVYNSYKYIYIIFIAKMHIFLVNVLAQLAQNIFIIFFDKNNKFKKKIKELIKNNIKSIYNVMLIEFILKKIINLV